MYAVFIKGIDFCERTFEGFDKNEAYEYYYEALSDASPSDEVILTLDGKIIEEEDCEDEQFEIFNSSEFSEGDEMDIVDFGL